MVKLLWRSDVHLSDQAPVSRKDDWTETVFTKLEQCRLVAQKVGVDAVLDGGDLFHVKSPSRNTHRLVERVAAHHAAYPCPVYCTPGNHDSVYGNYDFLGQQPLGVLYASGVLQRLYDEHEAVFESVEDFEVHGIQTTCKVRVVGVPYHGTSYDLDRFTSIQKGDEDFLVCVAHCLASPQGGTMYEGEDILWYRDLAALAPDLFLFGHWHKDQGVQEIGGTKFVNVGSVTRGALTQDDLQRRPAIVLLTFDRKAGIGVRVLRLRVQPVEEVFDMDARVRAEARSMTVDAFVSSVRETLVDTPSERFEDTVQKMRTVPDLVRERALEYWERANG